MQENQLMHSMRIKITSSRTHCKNWSNKPWVQPARAGSADQQGMVCHHYYSSKGKLFIKSFTSCAYDAADVMDNDNFATVLESFMISSLQIAQVNTKKVPGLAHLILMKKWDISLKKALHIFCHTTQHGVCTVLNLFSWKFRTNNHQLRYRRLPHNVYSDTLPM